MVNKKLLLGLLVLSGLQNIQGAADLNVADLDQEQITALLAANLEFPLRSERTPSPEGYDEYTDEQGVITQERVVELLRSKDVDSQLMKSADALMSNPTATIADYKIMMTALLSEMRLDARHAAAIEIGDDVTLSRLQEQIKDLENEIDTLRDKNEALMKQKTTIGEIYKIQCEDNIKLNEKIKKLNEKISALLQASDEQINIVTSRALKAELEAQELKKQLDNQQ